MAEHRSALSPAAARLLASVSRRIAERLPADASDDADAFVSQTAITAGSVGSAEQEAQVHPPQFTFGAAVLDVPVPLAESSMATDSVPPHWTEQRDTSAEVALTSEGLQRLGLQSGALVKIWNAAAAQSPAHLARVLEQPSGCIATMGSGSNTPPGGSPTANGYGSANDSSSDDEAWRAHLPPSMQNGSRPQANGVSGGQHWHSGDSPPKTQGANGTAWLSPELALNLGLACHLQPFLQLDKSGSSAPAAAPCELSDQQAPALLDAMCIQAYQPQHSAADAITSGSAAASSVKILMPGGEHVSLPAASSVTLAQLREPEPSPLPAEGEADDAAGGPSEPGSSGSPPLAADGRGHALAGLPAPEKRPPAGGGDQQDDAGFGDALTAALRRHFQAAPRLLAPGDTFAVAMPSVGAVDGMLSTLSGSSLSGASTAASGGVDLQPGGAGGRLLYFRVSELRPAADTALAVDPAGTAINIHGLTSGALPVGDGAYAAATARSCCSAATGASEPAVAADREPMTSAHAAAARLLGWSANAAKAGGAAALSGVGPLLPAWQEVAHILAPLFHPRAGDLGVRASVLLHGPHGSGRATAAAATAAAFGVHLVPVNCHDLKGDSEARTVAELRAVFRDAGELRPALLLLRHAEALSGAAKGPAAPASAHSAAAARLAAALARGIADGAPAADGQPPLAVIACVVTPDEVPAPLRRCFSHEVEVLAPDRGQRHALLTGLLGAAAGPDIDAAALDDAAAQSAGMLPADLRAVVADAAGAAAAELVDVLALLEGGEAAGGRPVPQKPAASSLTVTAAHLTSALAGAKKRAATAIGAPAIPDVRWEDVGGLDDVKAAILDTVELPLRHPQLFAAGLRQRSGVLLYGPPGTGKTLLAKAVATECALNFLSVKGPELINMYIGESERQVREVFARARAARPAVLFFDELDSLAPARGAGADSGGVMDRVVAQLLAEIDGAQSGTSGELFVIGATNRPDLLDSALLRPGRLDTLLYVGIAEDAAAKLPVLRALTRKFRMEPGVDLAAVAAAAPALASGADLYALAADAWTGALRRTIASFGDAPIPEDAEVVVGQDDLVAAAAALQPSLSPAEIANYTSLRDSYLQ